MTDRYSSERVELEKRESDCFVTALGAAFMNACVGLTEPSARKYALFSPTEAALGVPLVLISVAARSDSCPTLRSVNRSREDSVRLWPSFFEEQALPRVPVGVTKIRGTTCSRTSAARPV